MKEKEINEIEKEQKENEPIMKKIRGEKGIYKIF